MGEDVLSQAFVEGQDLPPSEVDVLDRSPILERAEGKAALQQVFDDEAPDAAAVIGQIARGDLEDDDPRVANLRFKAAVYIVDRALGRVPNAPEDGHEDPWKRLMTELSKPKSVGGEVEGSRPEREGSG